MYSKTQFFLLDMFFNICLFINDKNSQTVPTVYKRGLIGNFPKKKTQAN